MIFSRKSIKKDKNEVKLISVQSLKEKYTWEEKWGIDLVRKSFKKIKHIVIFAICFTTFVFQIFPIT